MKFSMLAFKDLKLLFLGFFNISNKTIMKKIISILIFVAAICQLSFGKNNPVLQIEGGKIQGVNTDTKNVLVYRGIPYAAAPIGDLRWKEPHAVVPWNDVKIADKFGNAAYQSSHVEGDFYQKEFFRQGDAPYSEDCLFLNVWTPASGEPVKKLPVAMWVHGGAYTSGWGFEPEMDGEAWAKNGVILVTINYRLGIFGFLAHPELSAENANHISGNYGMLDQIEALKWIVRNIKQFGGDPENITIFGQSAGAASIQTLVTSPLSKGIPARAIIQSGGGISDKALMGNSLFSDAEKNGKKLMDWAGYKDLKQMRSASTEEIFNVVQKYMKETHQYLGFSPVIDGSVLPESFSNAALAGRISDVPYMIGATMDDIGPLGSGDVIGRFCVSRENLGRKAFAYQFARPLPGDNAGAFHSSELWYVFNTLKRSWRPFVKGDYDLSNVMVKAWTNFAKYGDPNGAQNVKWVPYTKENPGFMIFKLEGNKEASGMGQLLPPSVKNNFQPRSSKN